MIQSPTKSSPVMRPLPTASSTNEAGYCQAARIHSHAIWL